MIESQAGKQAERVYTCIRTQLAYLLTGQPVLEEFINTENLILHLLSNLSQQMRSKSAVPWIEVSFHSLARSVAYQKKIDQFLAPLQEAGNSLEEQFIARLAWHKNHHCLPEGLPDPLKKNERLTPQNLKSKLNESLKQYMEKNIEEVLTLIFPQTFKRGLVGALYALEGKKMLVDLITYLAGEFVIKQIADPHSFALAILKSFGKETLSYETDAFGRNKDEVIYNAGIKISQGGYDQAKRVYEESLLNQEPGGLEAIMQRNEARKALRECLVDMIYMCIKTNEQFKHPGGILKATREKIGQIPVLGIATIGLHLLVSGSLFSLGYLFRKSDDQNMTLLAYLFKHLTGKKLAEYLADRIIELIYHPLWRMTLMQLMNDLVASLKNPLEAIQSKDLWAREDFALVSQFVLHHFNQGSAVPFQKNITSMVDGESAIKQMVAAMASQEGIIDKGLNSMTTVLKEQLLYIRVTDTYRKQGVVLEEGGRDAKFWECFVREWLNRNSSIRMRDNKNREPLNVHRKNLVDELLGLHGQVLKDKLSKTLEDDILPVGQIPNELINEKYFDFNLAQQDPDRPALRIVQD